jgi:hypothetical protein
LTASSALVAYGKQGGDKQPTRKEKNMKEMAEKLRRFT